MDGNEIVSRARAIYLEEFAAFVRHYSAKRGGGVAEAMFSIPQPNNLFGGHYRLDFCAKKGDEFFAHEMAPDKYLTFDPLEGAAGPTQVRMESLVWDDVEFAHDLSGT